MPRSSRERGTHDRSKREVETKEGSDGSGGGGGGGDDGGGGGGGSGGNIQGEASLTGKWHKRYRDCSTHFPDAPRTIERTPPFSPSDDKKPDALT